VKAWTTLARAGDLTLQHRDGVYVVRLAGQDLMSSRRHHSEEAMARLGLKQVRAAEPSVLIGGLGLGYSTRAALDALPAGARLTVAELSAVVVEWNRTLVAGLAGRPLEDPRVQVITGDVSQVLREHKSGFDCILLDVDNGPHPMSARNQPLYEAQGIAWVKTALRPGGAVVVWSAGPDERFLRRLSDGGLDARVERSRARPGGSAAHVLFVATRQ
jgi:spermidine synthase